MFSQSVDKRYRRIEMHYCVSACVCVLCAICTLYICNFEFESDPLNANDLLKTHQLTMKNRRQLSIQSLDYLISWNQLAFTQSSTKCVYIAKCVVVKSVVAMEKPPLLMMQRTDSWTTFFLDIYFSAKRWNTAIAFKYCEKYTMAFTGSNAIYKNMHK